MATIADAEHVMRSPKGYLAVSVQRVTIGIRALRIERIDGCHPNQFDPLLQSFRDDKVNKREHSQSFPTAAEINEQCEDGFLIEKLPAPFSDDWAYFIALCNDFFPGG